MTLDLTQKIDQLKLRATEEFKNVASEKQAEDLRISYLGKKGALTEILKEVGKLPSEQRPLVGQAVNAFKEFFEDALRVLLSEQEVKQIAESLQKERIDVTLPGRSLNLGHIHPVTQMMEEIQSFFLRFGFDIYGGPEIETDYYNFEALGVAADHPARDMQDTFYLSVGAVPRLPAGSLEGGRPSSEEGRHSDLPLLRTHTSPVQVHVMEKQRPPIRMIAPGVVYRKDSDVSHTPMFHQVEGLYIDRHVSMADLKGVLTEFFHFLFGSSVKLKFRPSYFPFTEPSAEVDISCVICGGQGCRVCKNTGWLEVMGCGMVDPVVFDHVKIDPEEYTGFAFGMGVERMAMLKYRIDDIRLFFENDVRFLKQF